MNSSAPAGSGPIYTIKGKTPIVAKGVFIAPSAAVIGDVELGRDSSIWFGCVLRGDEEPIRIGARTNIQDGVIIHTSRGLIPTTVGSDTVVGHGVILHGCTIGDGALVGIGAIVLDGAVIENGAVVAAGALVPPGKRVPAGETWAGCPARKLREISSQEMAFLQASPTHYVNQARLYLAAGMGQPAFMD